MEQGLLSNQNASTSESTHLDSNCSIIYCSDEVGGGGGGSNCESTEVRWSFKPKGKRSNRLVRLESREEAIYSSGRNVFTSKSRC